LGGRRGVFVPLNQAAAFRTLQLGTEDNDHVEVLSGLNEGDVVITTGARALRDSDRIVIAGETGSRRGGGAGPPGGGAAEGDERAGSGPGPNGAAPRRGRAGTPPEAPAVAAPGEGGVDFNGRRGGTGGTVYEARPQS